MTDLEKRVWADIEWAQQDAAVQSDYAGEWLALYEQKVIAHGKDRNEVLREAAAALQRPEEELAVWPIMDGSTLLKDSSLSPAISL